MYAFPSTTILPKSYESIIIEDFEKPPKTREYNPQVYKGWNEKIGKSKYSIDYFW